MMHGHKNIKLTIILEVPGRNPNADVQPRPIKARK